MKKSLLKHGGKSGILPRPHQIFKKPLKPVVVDKSVPQGYAPGIQHPRGSTRDPVIPQHVPLSEYKLRIQSKDTETPIEQKISGLGEGKRFRKLNGELRKQYLIEALEHEEKRLELQEKKEKAKAAREHAEEHKLKQMEFESATTKLTLPTIESFLEGPIKRERTPEEKRLLRMKRILNRLTTEYLQKEQKAADLLEVYYDAENFIVDEEHLSSAIEAAFGKSLFYFNAAQTEVGHKLTDKSYFETQHMKQINNKLNEALFGATGPNRPGFPEVMDTVTGDLKDLVLEAERRHEELANEGKTEFLRDLEK